MKTLIRKNFIPGLLIAITVLLIINVVYNMSTRKVLTHTYEIQEQTEAVKAQFNEIFRNTLRQIDLSLRGYALTKQPGMLSPYEEAFVLNAQNMKRIDSLLAIQQREDIQKEFAAFKIKLDEYLEYTKEMKRQIESDNVDAFLEMLAKDKGYDLYVIFQPLYSKVVRYENDLVLKAKSDYERTLGNNVIFQFALILVSFPTLGFIIYRLKKDERDRNKLLADFSESNAKYIYNPGKQTGTENASQIIENSVGNLKRASEFIREITHGNYQANWEGLNEKNAPLNTDNLVGNLVRMRDEMKRVKMDDEKRLWATEGLAKFSETVRNNQHSIATLTESVVRFLTKYLKSEQGSLFVLKDENDGDAYLELSSCFAFDRKKFVEKRVALGEGMLGQVYLEGTTSMLTKLPQGYTKITSGLGESTPSCLVIVPMKYNDKVECILELAGFRKLDKHEIEFLEKAGEFVASAIYNAKTAEKTTTLLKQSQEYAERLRQQEEEIRQNMEEMQATQEQSARQLRELEMHSIPMNGKKSA